VTGARLKLRGCRGRQPVAPVADDTIEKLESLLFDAVPLQPSIKETPDDRGRQRPDRNYKSYFHTVFIHA
jgi:hypothetical protein